MTEIDNQARQLRRRRRKPRMWPRIVAAVLALLFTFALGVAVGRALEDGPRGSTTVTLVRTLEPLPQTPVP